MNRKPFRLPWTGKLVPRALVDINRGCNIRCAACYNTGPAQIKSLGEIESDLDFLFSRRRLYAVSIIGGEVLLHPEICEIVRMIKRRGSSVEICTNGVLLNDERLDELKDAGVDLIFIHAERTQSRPDLPPNPTLADLKDLCEKKAALTARHGIDVGLSFTACRDNLDEMMEIVKFSIESSDVNYLLVTLHRDHSNFRGIRGDLDRGLKADLRDPSAPAPSCKMSMDEMNDLLVKKLNLVPFGFIGSSIDCEDPRWLSYLVGCVTDRSGTKKFSSVAPSVFEPLAMALSARVSGKYPTYLRQNTWGSRLQLVMNAALGGSVLSNLKLVAQSFRRGSTIRAKRLLFQNPADALEDGRVVHCLDCPDAIAKNGHLVPVCICDLVDVSA